MAGAPGSRRCCYAATADTADAAPELGHCRRKERANPDVIAPGLDLDATASAPWLIWRADSAALAANEAALGQGGFATTALGEYLASRNRSNEELAKDMQGFVVKTGNRLRRLLPHALQTFAPPTTSAQVTPPKLTEDDKIELARVLGVTGRVLENTLKKLSN